MVFFSTLVNFFPDFCPIVGGSKIFPLDGERIQIQKQFVKMIVYINIPFKAVDLNLFVFKAPLLSTTFDPPHNFNLIKYFRVWPNFIYIKITKQIILIFILF